MTRYRRCANAETKLPPFGPYQYIEWYTEGAGGGGRSIGKRFFTGQSNRTLYYTDGGTHGQQVWYAKDQGSKTWKPF